MDSATSSENLHSFQSPRHPIPLDGPLAVINATARLACENAVLVAAQGDMASAASRTLAVWLPADKAGS